MIKKEFIKVRGARCHNLKNIDIDIPKNKLVVITGPSGSGKSSLAFDTVYAEGQRRYVESLSAYARQFLQLMPKPDVDSIEGLSPAIAIEQKNTHNNPRSTVGTITEIYDYLRLLFSRVGTPYSPTTGKPISAFSIRQIANFVLEIPSKTKVLLLAPIVKERKGEHKKLIESLKIKGFTRFKLNDEIFSYEDLPPIDSKKKHTIEVVIDRLVIPAEKEESFEKRVVDSIETALKISDGIIIVEANERQTYSTKYACPESGFCITEMEPRLFSFNSPVGACEKCTGLGFVDDFDVDLIINTKDVPLKMNVILPWLKGADGESLGTNFYQKRMQYLEDVTSIKTSKSFNALTEEEKKELLFGSNYFEGIIPTLEKGFRKTKSYFMNYFDQFRSTKTCDVCNGQRLSKIALCVKINEKNISEVCNQSIKKACEFFKEIKLSPQQITIAEKILKEVGDRLGFLENIGLGYLTLDRVSGTLSGGELQRIRLASQIGSQLTGVLYVLDEPSIGLHQRDNEKLLVALKKMRDLGNTVIVIEHDEDTMMESDYIIDVGPKSGIYGGEIIAEGTPKEILKDKNSLTGEYLSGRKKIEVPKVRRKGNGQFLTIKGAHLNNLKHVDLKIPLGKLVCVTGVSGSGKSSLIMQTLRNLLHRRTLIKADSFSGLEDYTQCIDITQEPIGRTPRSNPATYVGLFTPIRDWFTQLPASRARGYAVGRFSFNVKGGRCEHCEGEGSIRVSMHFLPDVFTVCDVCRGKRFNHETLEITYKNASIADVLDMEVDAACDFFRDHPAIVKKLETLKRVGLGYLKLGQSAVTLSGGEAQRIKLAKELSKASRASTFYILDEPTTGLHFDDIQKLLMILHEFANKGHTVCVIEHNLDVIKTADWIVDMGPGGGDDGGQIIAQGTPEEVIKVKQSFTGQFLKKYLK